MHFAAYGHRMNRLPAIFSLIMFVAPAFAQTDDAPLIVETGQPVPLAGAAPSDSALAGDSYLLPITVRNRTAEPVRLRRIAVRPVSGIEVVDPNLDGIDNDRDGSVDEGDEGFDQFDELVSAWRIEEAVPTVAPGETLERAVVVRLPEASQAGSTQTLALIAAGSAANVTLRAEEEVSFSLAGPTLKLTLDGGDENLLFLASDTPLLEMKATIPSGRIADFNLVVEGSPAIDRYTSPRISLGSGVSCTQLPEPTFALRTLAALFEECQVDGGAPASQRYVSVEAKVQFSDADPFSGPQVIQAHRTIRLAGFAAQSDGVIGAPSIASGALSGPLIGAQLLSVSEQPVDAGDVFAATFRLVNRGNGTATGLRLIAPDDGLFDCKGLRLGDSKNVINVCEEGLPIKDMRPGSQREIKVTAALRDDALIGSPAALRLSAKDSNDVVNALPWAEVKKREPDPPKLAIASGGGWETREDIMTTRVGDAGTIVISGTLPEGQYPVSIRILSRVVDAQTGDPIGPASFTIQQFDASASDGTTIEKSDGEPITQTVGGWTAVTFPLGIVSVPLAPGPSAAGVKASARLSLRDLPEIQAGRLIEVAAELSLYGDTDIRSNDLIELLIAEPSLDLTLRSPDEDRTINLHDVTSIVALSCNQGNSSAEALILTARLPNSLILDTSEDARVFTIKSESANDGVTLFSSEMPSSGDIHYDADDRVLRGALTVGKALQPDTCMALAFKVRRSATFEPNEVTATIRAALEPFTGHAGAFARVYSGIDAGEIRFDVPPILFGPVSERKVSNERDISHIVSLELPEIAGEHRVDVSASSNTGLEWTILQLDDNGGAQPWRNGTAVASGQTVRFRLEANNSGARPLGWTDTTLVRALAFSDAALPIAASTRLITRREAPPGGLITVTKTMALDTDCDGNLNDERIQDALFEPAKDASPGDCVNFRIAFKHSGDKSMERIVVRDQVPAGTKLRVDAVEVLRVPEPLQDSTTEIPTSEGNDLIWTFEGLFEPGSEGEVSYAVQLLDTL